MTTEEIVAAVQASGARVEDLGQGRAKIVGKVPAEVLEAIRLNREAFLQAWTDEQRGRYGKTPPDCLLLRGEAPKWRPDVYRRVETWVRRQGEQVCLWATLRATAYWEAKQAVGWKPEEATAAALADVLHWQMSHWEKPEWQLQVFEEAVQEFQRKGLEVVA